MRYRRLGTSGVEVSIIGLGGTVFGRHQTFTHYSDRKQTAALIHHAADLGVNHLDTADMYADGVSERYVGAAIAGRRDRFIVASKVGMPRTDDPGDGGLSRRRIMAGIEGTLRRLQTDYVDLYYAHRPDPATPIEETVRAFDDLVRQGKVRHVGCSNFSRDQIEAAHGAAESRGYGRFAVSQSPYNLLERSLEAKIAPCCARHGMSIVAYAPLAQGVLTGKYRPGEPIRPGTRAWRNPSPNLAVYLRDDRLETVQRLDAWAADHGRRVGDLAIAWLLARPLVCSVLTAVTSQAQLEANAKAADWELTPEHVREAGNLVPG